MDAPNATIQGIESQEIPLMLSRPMPASTNDAARLLFCRFRTNEINWTAIGHKKSSATSALPTLGQP